MKDVLSSLESCGYHELVKLACIIKFSDNPGRDLLRVGYMGRCSRLINDKLRTRKLSQSDEELFGFIEIELYNSIELFEQHNNKIVFRDESRMFEEEDMLNILTWFYQRIGKVLHYPAFMSTYSCESLVPNNPSLLFKIQTAENSKAHYLADLNPKSTEKEVLFKSKSSFEIVGVNFDQKTVVLKETEQKCDIVIYYDAGYFSLSTKNSLDGNVNYLDDI